MPVKAEVEWNDLEIKSLHKKYKVTFDEDFKSVSSRLSEYRNSVFVIDRRVFLLYESLLETLIAGRPFVLVEANESTKTLTGVQNLIEWLLETGCNRSTTIIGIGGGIVQDLVTFTSNVFYRGASYVLVPTTLLSMCDSCIGAKCGINFGSYKNQLGVIYAPSGVHIVAQFLDSFRIGGNPEIGDYWITGFIQADEYTSRGTRAAWTPLTATDLSKSFDKAKNY